MLRAGKGAGAHVGGVARDRGFDGRPEVAIAPDESRHPRRQPKHVLEHENLTIAGHASPDLDRRYWDRSRDPPGERFSHRLNDHGEGTRLADCARVVLGRPPMRLLTALRAKRADGVDRLRGEADMAHDRDATFDQESDGLGHTATAFELHGTAAG